MKLQFGPLVAIGASRGYRGSYCGHMGPFLAAGASFVAAWALWLQGPPGPWGEFPWGPHGLDGDPLAISPTFSGIIALLFPPPTFSIMTHGYLDPKYNLLHRSTR